jgi:multidrug efflux pump subunit AcrA (membrane-fusion protein)
MRQANPCLRSDIRVVKQVLNGELNFVLKVPDSQKYYRFRPAEARVLKEFDGLRSPADIALALAEQGLRVSVAAVEKFAASCSRLGILERSLLERSTQQLERLRAERRRHRSLFRGELMRMRWSMGDPDRLLTRLLPYLRWCFTPAFVVASSVLMAVYLVIVIGSWSAFAGALVSLATLKSMTLSVAVILWMMAFLVYTVHEFAHAFTCKYFGGEVHEVGFMLIYFEPAFYCNVNDAWSFPDRAARLWVTAAGSWVQLVLASIAAIVWWAVRPDTILSNAAFSIMLVGGIATVLTNANPLIPLDGYFALSDWLEIPNLRQRAAAHSSWWTRRHLFGLDAPEPPATRRERRIFLIYGALAEIYIAFGLVLTAVFVLKVGWSVWGLTGGLLAFGVVLAISGKRLAGWGRGVRDGIRFWSRMLKDMAARRRLAPRVAGGFLALIVALAVLPWPITVSGPFRAATTRSVSVVAPQAGVVAEVLIHEGERVSAGTPLLRLRDPAGEREVELSARDVDSLASSAASARAVGDVAEATRLDAARAAAAARVEAAGRRVNALTVRAFEGGEVVTPRPERLLGRRLSAGENVLTLGDPDSVELRISLDGPGAADVRPGAIVRAISYADVGAPVQLSVINVGARGNVSANARGAEVRARLARTAAWRPGVQGEAQVELRQSTILGAMMWEGETIVRPGLFR